MKRDHTFSLSDVVSKGFEATYTAKDGTLYFWHRNFGVKVEKRTGKATLLTDPGGLPEARWVATSLGERELKGRPRRASSGSPARRYDSRGRRRARRAPAWTLWASRTRSLAQRVHWSIGT